MNIEFHSEPLYGDSAKYIKKKIKSYGNKKKKNIFKVKKYEKKMYHTNVCD